MEKNRSPKGAPLKTPLRALNARFSKGESARVRLFGAGKLLFASALALGALFFLNAQAAPAPQSGSVPEIVRRPDQPSEAVFPLDLSIGDLGPGTAAPDAYAFARRALNEVRDGKTDSPLLTPLSKRDRDELFARAALVAPRKVRVGGGREEAENSTSFLFRFIGREKELSGELFLSINGGGEWRLEDILPETPRGIGDATERDHPYSYTPYAPFW
jgi:hypothetical protein